MPGPRVYTVEEASHLIPELEAVFERLEELRGRLRSTKIRINALELIHGEAIREADNPDHREYLALVDDLERTTARFNQETQLVQDLGGVMKGVDPGLVDFYGVHGGHLVFLCWRRGEPAITHWHDVDTGFAGRRPLDEEPTG